MSIQEQARGKGRREVVLMAAISLAIVLVLTSCAGRWLKPHSNEKYLHEHSWLLNFDGIHYFYNEYLFEQNHAFLPFFVRIIQHFKKNIGQNATILLLHIVNRCVFVLCALEVYQILLCLRKGDQRFAKWGSIIFIFNPACIFYNVLYTESLFCFFSSKAIRIRLEGGNKWHSAIFLSLAVCLRSNGIFLSPIIGLQVIIELFNLIRSRKYIKSLEKIGEGFVILCIIIAPFCWHLYFSYCNICLNKNGPQICEESLPNIYSYVQQKYWNVGVLEYWRLGNIVFICLGLPAIAASMIGLPKLYSLSLPPSQQGLFLSFLLLLIVTILFTNIQSSTRFFSAHPIFILILADLARTCRIIRIWVISYFLCGSVMYSVGYPWT